MLNLEAYLAEESSTRDMVTERGFGSLISAKLDRYTGGSAAREAFSHLTKIERLPDISHALTSGQLQPGKLWKFRQTRVSADFREWFDEVGPKRPEDLIS